MRNKDIIVGVLDIQGAVIEHIDFLNKIDGVMGVRVKTANEIYSVDGLILPGGESTAIGKLLKVFKLDVVIRDRVKSGMPIWGTCAGMILLAREIVGEDSHLGLMNIKVRRNAYGSQLDSFVSQHLIPEISDNQLDLVYIRAPYIDSIYSGVDIIFKEGNDIVAAREKNIFVTSFHPELSKNLDFHKYFIDIIQNN